MTDTTFQQFPTTLTRKRDTASRGQWAPNTDVFLTDDMLVIRVELAGMRHEDLELSIEDNRLVISGQRTDGCRESKCSFQVMEINYGTFECTIEAPPGFDLSRAQAAYNNGFLRIDVPPMPQKPGRQKIPISGD